jgi:hypothetical protein
MPYRDLSPALARIEQLEGEARALKAEVAKLRYRTVPRAKAAVTNGVAAT